MQKMTANEYRTTLVCVDSAEDGILRGHLHNPYLHGAESFTGVLQFLSRMESLLDAMHFPQAFNAKREFASTGPPTVIGGESKECTGKAATFAVRILFRQNASWQGSVTWMEKDREESFRSVLELLLLMDGAMKESTH